MKIDIIIVLAIFVFLVFDIFTLRLGGGARQTSRAAWLEVLADGRREWPERRGRAEETDTEDKHNDLDVGGDLGDCEVTDGLLEDLRVGGLPAQRRARHAAICATGRHYEDKGNNKGLDLHLHTSGSGSCGLGGSQSSCDKGGAHYAMDFGAGSSSHFPRDRPDLRGGPCRVIATSRTRPRTTSSSAPSPAEAVNIDFGIGFDGDWNVLEDETLTVTSKLSDESEALTAPSGRPGTARDPKHHGKTARGRPLRSALGGRDGT